MSVAFPVSEPTQKILKNFAGIVDCVLLVEGKVQHVAPKTKAIFAVANLPEAWPKVTGIYNVASFLSVLSNFPKPAIQFEDDAMVIRDESSEKVFVKYRYSDPSTILTFPPKDFPHDNANVEFLMPETVLAQLKKMAAQLSLNKVVMSVDGGDVVVTVSDEKNTQSHLFNVRVTDDGTKLNGKFTRTQGFFRVDHLIMLLDGAYHVSLSTAWPYGYFVHKTLPVSYAVAMQKEKS